jgi:hypothetical protein
LLAGHLDAPAQRRAPLMQRQIEPNKLNLVGEDHPESALRRADEKKMVFERFQLPRYWEENGFSFKVGEDTKHGDSLTHLALQSLSFVALEVKSLERQVKSVVGLQANHETVVHEAIKTYVPPLIEDTVREVEELAQAVKHLEASGSEDYELIDQADELGIFLWDELTDYLLQIEHYLNEIEDAPHAQAAPIEEILARLSASIGVWNDRIAKLLKGQGYDLDSKVFAPTSPGEPTAEARAEKHIVGERSLHMYAMAEEAAEKARITGVWKIGDEHVEDMQHVQGPQSPHVAITSRAEFNTAYEAWKKPTAVEQERG